MNKNGFPNLYSYVDDLLYCSLPSNIYKSFTFLSDLLHQLGLKINPKKLVEPSISVVCLGILINTEYRTMSKSPDKLQEIINIMNGMLNGSVQKDNFSLCWGHFCTYVSV